MIAAPGLSELIKHSSLAAGVLAAGGIGFWLYRRFMVQRHDKSRVDVLLEQLGSMQDPEQIEQAFLELNFMEGHTHALQLPPTTITALCGFDTTNYKDSNALLELEIVRRRTFCLFAKTAVVWGASTGWSASLHSDSNNEAGIRTLRAMTLFAAHVHKLDGFVMDVQLDDDSLEGHAEAVRQTFNWLSKHDPSGRGCMESRFIGRHGWVFHFAGCEMFVTSFNGCYPESNSRHCPQQRTTIILFQPYTSFLLHAIGNETPKSVTEWDNPRSMRDRIRARFRNHGVWYEIPEEPHRYPAAHNVVMPLQDGDAVVEWWRQESDAN
eukprot:TRINITY_DN7586_c0_g1_i1.p1 TRINITY_DN7586_c0_g1~~TRINITY_DN7586_c0_g1_i1.p1  ORF type:complete len:323 (+),score=48.02 TRINITY_DN7586_c0_g1_i1:180-1148(+)